MLATYLAPLVCLVGLLMFALGPSAKIADAGKTMFAVGLLVTLLRLSASLHF